MRFIMADHRLGYEEERRNRQQRTIVRCFFSLAPKACLADIPREG